MSREFVLYSYNHALQYIVQQPKLKHKHAKWVEYLQGFNFVLKHISGQANKVADALSRRHMLVQETNFEVAGFDFLKDSYKTDPDFREAFEACSNPVLTDRSQWLDYFLQEDLLFRRSQLSVPKCSMRENLIKEKHSSGLARHFGTDKTYEQLSHFHYWPKMRAEVDEFVKN